MFIFFFPFKLQKDIQGDRQTDEKMTRVAYSYDRIMKAFHFQKVAKRGNVCAIYEDLSKTCIWSLTCYLPHLMYKAI